MKAVIEMDIFGKSDVTVQPKLAKRHVSWTT